MDIGNSENYLGIGNNRGYELDKSGYVDVDVDVGIAVDVDVDVDVDVQRKLSGCNPSRCSSCSGVRSLQAAWAAKRGGGCGIFPAQ